MKTPQFILAMALGFALLGGGAGAAMQATNRTPAAHGPWCDPWGPNASGPGAN